MDGVIVVDKAESWTSHDVVGKFRGIGRTRKVGHLGTLDPIATGVLPLIVGQATRLARFYTKADKTYEASVRLGFATDTYDRSGVPTSEPVPVSLTVDAIDAALNSFRGPIAQMPPQYSAKKVDGVAAYKSARQKIPVELSPVDVEIYELKILDFAASDLRLLVRCSAGTYVRSIAHDLGQALGCGAHLRELRRLASGEFTIERARTLPELQTLANEERLREALIPLSEMLPQFPSVFVDDITAAQIRQGRDFHGSPFTSGGTAHVKAFANDGTLIAVGQAILPNLYHPVVVLA
ncbi:MAG: tRNA pseudouridine synthase [Bryobacterales bacterium]|nr:tRNA pseudouridine synthase [Bryobacterales bacterium]